MDYLFNFMTFLASDEGEIICDIIEMPLRSVKSLWKLGWEPLAVEEMVPSQPDMEQFCHKNILEYLLFILNSMDNNVFILFKSFFIRLLIQYGEEKLRHYLMNRYPRLFDTRNREFILFPNDIGSQFNGAGDRTPFLLLPEEIMNFPDQFQMARRTISTYSTVRRQRPRLRRRTREERSSISSEPTPHINYFLEDDREMLEDNQFFQTIMLNRMESIQTINDLIENLHIMDFDEFTYRFYDKFLRKILLNFLVKLFTYPLHVMEYRLTAQIADEIEYKLFYEDFFSENNSMKLDEYLRQLIDGKNTRKMNKLLEKKYELTYFNDVINPLYDYLEVKGNTRNNFSGLFSIIPNHQKYSAWNILNNLYELHKNRNSFYNGFLPSFLADSYELWCNDFCLDFYNTYFVRSGFLQMLHPFFTRQRLRQCQIISHVIADIFSYPIAQSLQIVSMVTAVNNSGLRLGHPPYQPVFTNGLDLFTNLSQFN
ncbi:hypothetical protein SNEBB_000293 [Seison nebaliae]|nr:hypothetical protein SNEBB_000293 [Seison nebaliae]